MEYPIETKKPMASEAVARMIINLYEGGIPNYKLTELHIGGDELACAVATPDFSALEGHTYFHVATKKSDLITEDGRKTNKSRRFVVKEGTIDTVLLGIAVIEFRETQSQ